MKEKPDRQHLIFMDLFFLLYSIYDGAEDKSQVIKLTGRAYGSFLTGNADKLKG